MSIRRTELPTAGLVGPAAPSRESRGERRLRAILDLALATQRMELGSDTTEPTGTRPPDAPRADPPIVPFPAPRPEPHPPPARVTPPPRHQRRLPRSLTCPPPPPPPNKPRLVLEMQPSQDAVVPYEPMKLCGTVVQRLLLKDLPTDTLRYLLLAKLGEEGAEYLRLLVDVRVMPFSHVLDVCRDIFRTHVDWSEEDGVLWPLVEANVLEGPFVSYDRDGKIEKDVEHYELNEDAFLSWNETQHDFWRGEATKLYPILDPARAGDVLELTTLGTIRRDPTEFPNPIWE